MAHFFFIPYSLLQAFSNQAILSRQRKKYTTYAREEKRQGGVSI
jgi:hypothetical protein